MRKISIWLVLVILSQACSMNQIFLVPTATPAPPTLTPFSPSTPLDTVTPTHTSTPMPSATVVRIPTQDPSQVAPTFMPVPIYIDGKTATPMVSSTPFRPGGGFTLVTVSEGRIYWGGCKHNQTIITAQVEETDEVVSVILFTRAKDAESEDYTPWTNGNVMYNNGSGRFTYKMVGSEVEGHNHYKKLWVFFQLVATNIKGEEIGRTKIYTDQIAMSPCMCLDPSTGCPPTAQPAKP